MHISPRGTKTPRNPPSTTLGSEAHQRDTGADNEDETDRGPVTGGEYLAASRSTSVAAWKAPSGG
jgi:hypothetical protein